MLKCFDVIKRINEFKRQRDENKKKPELICRHFPCRKHRYDHHHDNRAEYKSKPVYNIRMDAFELFELIILERNCDSIDDTDNKAHGD